MRKKIEFTVLLGCDVLSGQKCRHRDKNATEEHLAKRPIAGPIPIPFTFLFTELCTTIYYNSEENIFIITALRTSNLLHRKLSNFQVFFIYNHKCRNKNP
jgi:hypothetical protein